MAQREFPMRRMLIDDHPATVTPIECHRCGVTARFKHSGMKRKPAEAIEQYFRNHGWRVGSVPRGDVCPDCQTREKPPLAAAAPDDTVVAEPPRTMEREERRIVFAHIDQHYLPDRSGYAAPWTDARIAKDLGVPRAWVTEIRDQMFGPEGSNPDIEQFRADLSAAKAEFKDIRDQAATAAHAHNALDQRLGEALGRLDALGALARRIEKDIGA
ncbi:MAG: hypothetical protein ABTQ31_10150 [Rhizobiaceae bacterium]